MEVDTWIGAAQSLAVPYNVAPPLSKSSPDSTLTGCPSQVRISPYLLVLFVMRELTGSIPRTAKDRFLGGSMFYRLSAQRRVNMPCGIFGRSVQGAAMSRKLARPRAGVAKFPSVGEEIFVTAPVRVIHNRGWSPLSGRSIPVVHTLRVRVDRVRFPAARKRTSKGRAVV